MRREERIASLLGLLDMGEALNPDAEREITETLDHDPEAIIDYLLGLLDA